MGNPWETFIGSVHWPLPAPASVPVPVGSGPWTSFLSERAGVSPLSSHLAEELKSNPSSALCACGSHPMRSSGRGSSDLPGGDSGQHLRLSGKDKTSCVNWSAHRDGPVRPCELPKAEVQQD